MHHFPVQNRYLLTWYVLYFYLTCIFACIWPSENGLVILHYIESFNTLKLKWTRIEVIHYQIAVKCKYSKIIFSFLVARLHINTFFLFTHCLIFEARLEYLANKRTIYLVIYIAFFSLNSTTYPPIESGKYMSWFSSTFRVVNFFSAPAFKIKIKKIILIQEAHYKSHTVSINCILFKKGRFSGFKCNSGFKIKSELCGCPYI